MGVVRSDLKGPNHKWRPLPYKYQDLGLSVKLHQGLWHDIVRLCAKFVNISTHLLVELVGVNLLFLVVPRVNQIGLEFDNNF